MENWVGQAEAESGSLPPPPHTLAGEFPGLEIVELLGRGSMGYVYMARQIALDRLVALKILSSRVACDPAFAERFAREARALAKLNHPHIVTIHDFGRTAGGLFFFVMEFVDGASLRHLLATGAITPQAALVIVPQICEALQYAHDHGVVHRDIKPENILLDKQGAVKIADFGLAKLAGRKTGDVTLTETGAAMGTLHYMAPEQTEHPQDVDHRADIYSLGVVFYQMLTGELPLGRFAPPSQKVRIDVRLDEVVLKALEKEPERRYQQAREVQTDVQTIRTTPPTPGARVGKRRSVAWLILAVVAVPSAAGIVIAALLLGSIISRRTGRPNQVTSGHLVPAIQRIPPYPRLPMPSRGVASTVRGSLPPTMIRMVTTSSGSLCLLPRSWESVKALSLVGKAVFLGGTGKPQSGIPTPRLARLDWGEKRFQDLSTLFPDYWSAVKTLTCGDGQLMIGGDSSPEPGGFGVKVRPVAAIYDPQADQFNDLSSALRRVDPDPYILGLGGIAYEEGNFIIGGAGGYTFLVTYSPATRRFQSLTARVPYYFAVNAVVALGREALVIGAGAGPGGEPGTPPALGLISGNGQFTDLTTSVTAGLGVMAAAGYDGHECLIQGFNTVDAHQMLELFDPRTRIFRNVSALFPRGLSIEFISGAPGRFLIGGFIGPGAYLATCQPATGQVRDITASLPFGARRADAGLFDGEKIIMAGQTAQDRAFVEMLAGHFDGPAAP